MELHETIMGKRLIEHTLPEILNQLKRIANSLEKLEAKDKEEEEEADLDHLSSLMYGVDNNQ